MKQELALNWALQLETHTNRQGYGKLHQLPRDGEGDKFCALGELANVLNCKHEPEIVKELAGLSSEEYQNFVDANDGHVLNEILSISENDYVCYPEATFTQIAAVIRKDNEND